MNARRWRYAKILQGDITDRHSSAGGRRYPVFLWAVENKEPGPRKARSFANRGQWASHLIFPVDHVRGSTSRSRQGGNRGADALSHLVQSSSRAGTRL